MTTWQEFVIANGWRADAEHLAVVVGQAIEAVARVRSAGCVHLPSPLDFGELFSRWHGRRPTDDEWPAPRRHGRRPYDWYSPELDLLARLVGTMSVWQITDTLTERLRRITGDASASRTRESVRIQINRLGLQAGTDLTGGLTTREAAQRVGRVSLIDQAIHGGQLRTFRVGKRHVIPRDEFERWLATREQPPEGWVRLASLTKPLGISSDSKLPEYAALGHIPGARLVKGIGTARGVWYIPPELATQIVDDAKAGRPLPWYGKPLPGNQLAMWKKWQRRKHRNCPQCAAIWNGDPPPTFEAFCDRYTSLTIGEKRHLTRVGRRSKPSRPWGTCRGHRSAGVTVYEAARQLQQPSRWIRSWIRRGLFQWGGLERDPLGGEAVRITPLGMSILKTVADGEANAADNREWFGVHVAAQIAGVCITTVHRWRATGQVTTRRGARGIEFERASLEARSRTYWAWAKRRFKRAMPPAWLEEVA